MSLTAKRRQCDEGRDPRARVHIDVDDPFEGRLADRLRLQQPAADRSACTREVLAVQAAAVAALNGPPGHRRAEPSSLQKAPRRAGRKLLARRLEHPGRAREHVCVGANAGGFSKSRLFSTPTVDRVPPALHLHPIHRDRLRDRPEDAGATGSKAKAAPKVPSPAGTCCPPADGRGSFNEGEPKLSATPQASLDEIGGVIDGRS
jgi:hypothetical protein